VKEIYKNNRQIFFFIVVSNFMLYCGFRIWQTMFNNFAVEEIGVRPVDIGWIQSLREVPGFLAFILGIITLFISEAKIMGFSIILLGIGIFLTGHVYTVPYFIMATVLMSIGFHFFVPCNSAIVMMLTKSKDAPKTMGQLRSIGAVAALTGSVIVYVLTGFLNYRQIFMLLGLILTAGGVVLLFMKGLKENLPLFRKIKLRKRYGLYYVLAFLMGSRRHIFTTFAIFLLIKKFGISVQTTAILFMINSFINIFSLQVVGRLVGRYGERLMLSISFSLLILIFLGYAFINSLPVLFLFFIVDNILFGFNLALKTYFKKIVVSDDEITSNFSVELAINHLAALVIPVTGGIIWQAIGSQAPFLIGAGMLVISLVLMQFIRTTPGKILL